MDLIISATNTLQQHIMVVRMTIQWVLPKQNFDFLIKIKVKDENLLRINMTNLACNICQVKSDDTDKNKWG